MSYNAEFYELYSTYLEEPTVRANHDEVFEFFHALPGTQHNVVDLGCGTGEYMRHGRHVTAYIGLDKQDTPKAGIVCDYTKELPKLPFEPTAFVSIFSIEACLPLKHRYEIYERMFKDYPICKALVSGFYYEGKADKKLVKETGGITSHQTIEPLEAYSSDNFSETRISMRTPSEMFGEDVVEIWKILRRK